MSLNLGRRSFLWSATSLAMLGLDRLTGANAQTAIPSAPPLPSRSDFVIRGAYVLTMDRSLGELPQGDVHVRNGVIAAVGPNIDAPGATVIDGSNAVVLPGLVDTHWHLWTTLLRGMVGEKPDQFYFPMSGALGKVFQPADAYQGTRLSTMEALYSGITTVTDWSHINPTPKPTSRRSRTAASVRAISTVRTRASRRTSQAIWPSSSVSGTNGRAIPTTG
jgi:5-methylthioadenosine/S-adenosylhomocysteine deaminase